MLDDGRKVTLEIVRAMMPEVLAGILASEKEKRLVAGNYAQASRVFDELISREPIVDFLTNYCYEAME